MTTGFHPFDQLEKPGSRPVSSLSMIEEHTGLSRSTSPNQPDMQRTLRNQFRLSVHTQDAQSVSVTHDKAAKRKAQGRILKMKGDLYVLSGRLSDGMSRLVNALVGGTALTSMFTAMQNQ